MPGYRYGGTEFDAHLPLAIPKVRKKYEYGASKCGTYAGYDKHRRAKETVCEPCAQSRRDYLRDYRQRVRLNQGKPPLRKVAECGTNSGYVLHQRKKETPCQPCRNAHADYGRDYRARKAAA